MERKKNKFCNLIFGKVSNLVDSRLVEMGMKNSWIKIGGNFTRNVGKIDFLLLFDNPDFFRRFFDISFVLWFKKVVRTKF